jgi:hypothetical protein
MSTAFVKIHAHWSRRVESRFLDMVALLLCGYLLYLGIRTTGDLNWPGNIDLYRNMAQAQSILDGNWWADPYYLGETMWYNPLAPFLIAAVSRVANLPVYIVSARLGAYFNLLSPLSFYFLVARLFDRWTALASTLGFLFVTSEGLAVDSITPYSPWLYAATFTQSMFYLTLVAYRHSVVQGRRRGYVVTGVLWGITFLGHTAPALVLGGIMGLSALAAVIRSWRDRLVLPTLYHVVNRLAPTVVAALVVSAPLLCSIVGHYHLRVLNPYPASLVADFLAVSKLATLIKANLTVPTCVAGIGLLGLLWRRSRAVDRRLVLLWSLVSSGLVAYGYFWLAARHWKVSLPIIVPTYHFWYYLRVVEAILFGYGLVVASRCGVGLLERWAPVISRQFSMQSRARLWSGRALLCVLMSSLLLVCPSFASRPEFALARVEAQQAGAQFRLGEFEWIREHTRPEDVFLAPDSLGMFLVGPTGRKLAAVHSLYSNPYVDNEARVAARDAIFECIRVGDYAGFDRLASKNRVTYLVLWQAQVQGETDPFFLAREFSDDQVIIYRVVHSRPQSQSLEKGT